MKSDAIVTLHAFSNGLFGLGACREMQGIQVLDLDAFIEALRAGVVIRFPLRLMLWIPPMAATAVLKSLHTGSAVRVKNQSLAGIAVLDRVAQCLDGQVPVDRLADGPPDHAP